MTGAPKGTAGPRRLADRARAAAARHRLADSAGFGRRHADWSGWTRRAQVARTVAAVLEVPVGAVLVTDDPVRGYGIAGHLPGDLITVIDPVDGSAWRFIPAAASAGQTWLVLAACPSGCGGEVPLARVATLADLGDWLKPGRDERLDGLPEEHSADPGHAPSCARRRLTGPAD